MSVSSSSLLAGLTEAQRRAVTAEETPLCVLASAGSGKTTVLTRRVARRVLDGSARAEHVLVVTFTRKAATELRSRIARLGVSGDAWAGTIHAAAYAQLRRHWVDRDIRPPSILDDPARLLKRILVAPGDGDGSGGSAFSARGSSIFDPRLIGAVAAEIHWAQARQVLPAGYAQAARTARRRAPLAPQQIAEVYDRYTLEKRRRRLVDVDDLLEQCAHVMETDDVVASAQRWRIRHIFVDEFQDLNPAQWRLLRAWLGDRDDLFVVGDPRQAVYGWNGADPTLIERLPEMLEGTMVIRLDANHRSSPQIVAAARAVITAGGSQESDGVSETPVGDRGTGPVDGPEPVVIGFEGDEEEATAVMRWLRRAHAPGTTWSRLAVLARTNSRLEPIAAALRRAGIPHRFTGAADRPQRPDALRRAVDRLRKLPPERLLRSALLELGVDAEREHDGEPPRDDTETTTVVPRALRHLVEEHASIEPGGTVVDFLDWLVAGDALSEAPDEGVPEQREPLGDVGGESSNEGRVEVTTFHKAKGLEWRSVAVIGLENGIVPIAYAATPEELAEERRLLYVALTRAEEELWCSWAANRHSGGREWACERSPLLQPVEDAIASARRLEDVETRLARISQLRGLLPAAG